ncbi:hypothetical protein Tco_1208569 [Tanacetum coccineum]
MQYAHETKISSGTGNPAGILLANNAQRCKERYVSYDSCPNYAPVPKCQNTHDVIMAPWLILPMGDGLFTNTTTEAPESKAHRTSLKTSNRETPYILTFRSEAVIPAKVGMPIHRTMMIKDRKDNEEEIRLNLDLLTERREAVTIREARYKTKVEQYYNKRVRPMAFKVGEYVYRRNEASRVEDLGKLGPKWEGPYLVIEAYDNGSYKFQTMEGREVPRTWHAINLRRCYLLKLLFLI